ncbi:uncharacterized protein [Dermacentor albipictus]|uniref:uncharacterized protein n=1 Tax=Dermacentor albipictus TaxID=60249 RepID=UPI0038FCFEBD
MATSDGTEMHLEHTQIPLPDEPAGGDWLTVKYGRKKASTPTNPPLQPRHPSFHRQPRLPPLPRNDLKVIIRPREGLNLATWTTPQVAEGIKLASKKQKGTTKSARVKCFRKEEDDEEPSTKAHHVRKEEKKNDHYCEKGCKRKSGSAALRRRNALASRSLTARSAVDDELFSSEFPTISAEAQVLNQADILGKFACLRCGAPYSQAATIQLLSAHEVDLSVIKQRASGNSDRHRSMQQCTKHHTAVADSGCRRAPRRVHRSSHLTQELQVIPLPCDAMEITTQV